MNLFNVPVVQVALSVIISLALFAILVGLIQEAIAQIMAERGRFMKSYLLRQLQDESNGINWAGLLYLHGSIDLLTRQENKPTNDINPTLFAQVLIEVVGTAHIVQIKKEKNNYENLLLSNFKSATQTLKPSDVISFLKLALASAEIKKSSSGNASDEEAIYDDLVAQISNWYKEFGERLSLWYKKKIRKKLFIIGFILALLVNVDSIQLFNFYKLNPESALAVQKYYNEYIAATDSIHHHAIPNDIVLYKEGLDSLVQIAQLPVGFDYNVFKSTPNTGSGIAWKIWGILITGFAVSFGAPFWFDLIKKAYSKKIPI